MKLAGNRAAGLEKAVVLALTGLLAAGPAPAADPEDVQERIFEVQPVTGILFPDDNADYDGTPLFGVRAAINNSPYWGLEGQIALGPSTAKEYQRGMLLSYRSQPAISTLGDTLGHIITNMQTSETPAKSDGNLLMLGGSIIVHLTKSRIRPFLTVGGGFIDDLGNSGDELPGALSDPYAEAGIGVKYYRKSGWGVRVDFRDVVMRKDDLARENSRAALLAAQFDAASGGGSDGIPNQEPYDPIEHRGRRWLHNLGVQVSLTVPFGWVWKDGDGDQIADRFDDCLTTAPGVIVDQVGCGIDTDEDGVFDGLDQCEATPIGAIVDLSGCPSDADGDGVLDGLDLMDDTPAGALVDAQGRHYDTDGDGVFDGLDLCNDTPLGASIDLDGCAENPVEERLLRRESIVLASVEFEPGTDEIEPLSYHGLNKIARLLEHWTGNEERPLRMEIGVHTDGVGAESYNLDLSRRRAEKVRIYMLENFFGMGANNLVAVGYGESMPLADDNTEEGRRKNRRVEIRYVGPGDPPEEYDWGAEDYEEISPEEIFETPAAEAGETRESGIVVPEPILPEPELPSVPEEPEMPDLDGE